MIIRTNTGLFGPAALLVLASLVLASPAQAPAQQPVRDALLDRLVGRWVLTGTIMGQQTTHDVVAEWILKHQYVRLHEVSREKDSTGAPAYEAYVHIGWNEKPHTYSCFWLDDTSPAGVVPSSVGFAPKTGADSIAFFWESSGGIPFHNTFVYDRKADRWRWVMDGEKDGVRQPFARLTLMRRK